MTTRILGSFLPHTSHGKNALVSTLSKILGDKGIRFLGVQKTQDGEHFSLILITKARPSVFSF